jgi:hypothetical protein
MLRLCIQPVITASTAGNPPQICDKNILTVFQYLAAMVLQKLHKSNDNLRKMPKKSTPNTLKTRWLL